MFDTSLAFFLPLPPFTLFLHTMLRPGAVFFCFRTEACAVPGNRSLEELLEIVGSVVNVPQRSHFQMTHSRFLVASVFFMSDAPEPRRII